MAKLTSVSFNGNSSDVVDAYSKSETYSKTEADTLLEGKQATLTPGSGINISSNNVISATGSSVNLYDAPLDDNGDVHTGGAITPTGLKNSLYSTNGGVNITGALRDGQTRETALSAVAIGAGANIDGASGSDNNIAVGYNSSAISNGIAMGANAQASGLPGAIALGHSASARSSRAVAVGFESFARNLSDIAIGDDAQATGTQSFAVGSGTRSSGSGSLAIGVGARALARSSIVIGGQGYSDADESIVIGYSMATNENSSSQQGQMPSIAIGVEQHTWDGGIHIGITDTQKSSVNTNGITIGNHMSGPELGKHIMIGEEHTAAQSATNTILIGQKSEATGSEAIVIGTKPQAQEGDGAIGGTGAVVVGARTSGGDYAVSVGSGAGATTASVAVGSSAGAGGEDAVAIGEIASADSQDAIALGHGAEAAAIGAVAVGAGAGAKVMGGIAIGYGADVAVGETNAVAIGAGSESGGSDTISVGNTSLKRKIVNVADGTNATDAATKGQLDAAIAALQAQIDALRS